ncbi:hypothetical protein [Acinetobacter sp. YH1901134]|uniref:hypothetical protein n=1 Tax=Acinetobacter sp. YH1901134 TaxID=2601199 RepID=UPI00211ED1E6|nr:hypothetical protein [Acinetobacter sp. YH1901134]
MSRKTIMTTNERRLQALNQMRASYRGVQLLRQDRIKLIQHGAVVQSHEGSINDSDRTLCDDLSIEVDECDMLKKNG